MKDRATIDNTSLSIMCKLIFRKKHVNHYFKKKSKTVKKITVLIKLASLAYMRRIYSGITQSENFTTALDIWF